MFICLLLFTPLHLAGFYGLSAGAVGWHSVTELWNWVGRGSKPHPVPTLCHRQGHSHQTTLL